METYKRILVCINQPERDARMLGYTGAISRSAKSDEIHLLHVHSPEVDSGGETSEATPPAEITPDTLHGLANQHFTGHGKEQFICRVVPGTPLLEILRYAHDQDIDIIVIGRSSNEEESEHRALLARRVTRKATCSVLVLPKDVPVRANTIVVLVRDSECSANAVDVACHIARAGEAKVVCLNVYQVHAGYSRVGKTFEEYRSAVEAAAKRESTHLLTRVDTAGVSVTADYLPDLYDRAWHVILEATTRMSADLLVIGARGRTGAAGVLLGAVTEKLIQQSPVPVLAVKKKGECLGIIRALLTLAGQE